MLSEIEIIKVLVVLLVFDELFPFLKFISKNFRGVDSWLFLFLGIVHFIHRILDGSYFKTIQENNNYSQEKRLKEIIEKILEEKTVSDKSIEDLTKLKEIQKQIQDLEKSF